MIPIKLSLSGFTSYLEPVEIDFTGLDLVCISGQNGSGKSSLLDAMTYALYGQARRRDEGIIHHASTTINSTNVKPFFLRQIALAQTGIPPNPPPQKR